MKFLYLLATIFAFITYINAVRLGNYKIKNGITTSGISAGGAMANQLHVAHSSIITGSGIVAGPPYYCAGGNMLTATTTCMSSTLTTSINMATIFNKVSTYKTQNLIDDPVNLRNHYVYVYSGSMDFTVRTAVVKKNEDFFSNYMDANRIRAVYNFSSTHGMITDFYGSSCGVTSTYYINNCNYNQAHDIFRTLYPSETILFPVKGGSVTGTFIQFDQSEFFPFGSATSISMDNNGYLYVPKQCETNECGLHIAFHGCLQGAYKIADVYVKNSGYNQVADLNNFIILYPQAKSSLTTNPNGCWDWWGYADTNYANKNGKQIQAVKKMIDRIAFNK